MTTRKVLCNVSPLGFLILCEIEEQLYEDLRGGVNSREEIDFGSVMYNESTILLGVKNIENYYIDENETVLRSLKRLRFSDLLISGL